MRVISLATRKIRTSYVDFEKSCWLLAESRQELSTNHRAPVAILMDGNAFVNIYTAWVYIYGHWSIENQNYGRQILVHFFKLGALETLKFHRFYFLCFGQILVVFGNGNTDLKIKSPSLHSWRFLRAEMIIVLTDGCVSQVLDLLMKYHTGMSLLSDLSVG